MFLYAPEETSGFKRTLGVGNASKQLSEDPGDIQSPVNTNQQTHTYIIINIMASNTTVSCVVYSKLS